MNPLHKIDHFKRSEKRTAIYNEIRDTTTQQQQQQMFHWLGWKGTSVFSFTAKTKVKGFLRRLFRSCCCGCLFTLKNIIAGLAHTTIISDYAPMYHYCFSFFSLPSFNFLMFCFFFSSSKSIFVCHSFSYTIVGSNVQYSIHYALKCYRIDCFFLLFRWIYWICAMRWIILKRGSNPLIIEIIENELILVKHCW